VTRALVLASLVVAAVATSTEVRAANTAAGAYERARAIYFGLKDDAHKQRFRHHWMKAIAAFSEVASAYAGTDEAARASFTTAELWTDLYAVSRRSSDLEQAIAAYTRTAQRHPKASLADDALLAAARLLAQRDKKTEARTLLSRALAGYPNGDAAAAVRQLLGKL
jgi:TolA-binding protein